MNPRQVLIVEDDELIRDFLMDCLEMKGFAVQLASNGLIALDVLGREEVDVVLSDVQMPEMDGLRLCEQLADERPELPVVLMTGVHASRREEILKTSGAVECLPKPLRIEQLVSSLEGALAG